MRDTTRLHVLRDSIRVIERLRPIVGVIGSRDRGLADQIRRAASSIALNLAEAEGSSGGNRRARFQTALGSTKEVRVALEVASAWGYVETSADLDDALDHIAARTWRLARGS